MYAKKVKLSDGFKGFFELNSAICLTVRYCGGLGALLTHLIILEAIQNQQEIHQQLSKIHNREVSKASILALLKFRSSLIIVLDTGRISYLAFDNF